jgi:hypothetical protein
MAFTNFDIIGALRTYCTTNSIKFIWQYDEFYANIQATQQYDPDELILVVDLLPNPLLSGNKVSEITYNGLFMLGRKFDNINTTSATLDEHALQKYDRRLLDLTALLVFHATAFKCAHELDLNIGDINYLFNAFDTNIDFVAAQAIQFIQ